MSRIYECTLIAEVVGGELIIYETVYCNVDDSFRLMKKVGTNPAVIFACAVFGRVDTFYAKTGSSVKYAITPNFNDRVDIPSGLRIDSISFKHGGFDVFNVVFPNEKFSIYHWDSEYLYAEFQFFEKLAKEDFAAYKERQEAVKKMAEQSSTSTKSIPALVKLTPGHHDHKNAIVNFKLLQDLGHIREDFDGLCIDRFECFEGLSWGSPDLMEKLPHAGETFDATNCKFIQSELAENQMCHRVAAKEFLIHNDPDRYAIYTGLADKAYPHTWLYDKQENVIIEPTPIDREVYFGLEVSNPWVLVEFYFKDYQRQQGLFK
jgi:hypothetical protein